MNNKQHRATLLAWASVAAIVSACGGPDAARSLSLAKEHLAHKETKAAVIELKNVLQARPDLAEARFLLGKAELDSGDFASALSELRRARELKYPDDLVVPALARALLHEQQIQPLIEQFAALDLSEKVAVADLQTSLASAYLASNDVAKSQAAVKSALTAVPNYPSAVRIKAVGLAQAGHFDAAIDTLQTLLQQVPNDADAWHTKGEFLLYGRHDTPGAIQAYRQAVAIAPSDVNTRVSLITALLSQHDLPAASAEIEALRKIAPRQLQTAYFDAQMAYFRNDFKRAHEITDQLTRLLPDNVQVRQLAGAVEFKLGLLLEAERSLSRALQLTPDAPTGRRLLAQIYLRLGQPAKALETLAPLMSESTRDVEAVTLAAEANVQLRNVPQTTANLAKAVALNPGDMTNRVALVLSKTRKGHEQDVVAELRALAASDKGTYVDLTLASIYVHDKDFPSALKAVDAAEAKEPGKALTANIRGQIYLMQNDVGNARGSFERALAIDPTFIPAASTLASLDLADKHPEKARMRFDSVLQADPKNVNALMALAGLKAKAGATAAEVEAMMRDGIKLNPAAVEPRMLLVDSQIKRQDFKAALGTAHDAVNALPKSAPALDALGRAEWAAGDAIQAISTFEKLAALDESSPTAWLRLSSVQMAQHDNEAAIVNLKKALGIDPDLVEAQRALISCLMSVGRSEEALGVARIVQKRHPDQPAGSLLEAGVQMSANKPAVAAEIYRGVLKRFPDAPAAIPLYKALASANRPSDADQFAATWVAAHPKDAEFLFTVGEAALARQDYASAEARFRAVLAITPENAAALNNLAWTLTTVGKPGAVEMAQRATTLVPTSAPLWDTLASALEGEHRLPEAVTAESRAVSLAGNRSAFRVHLAKLHLDAGDKAKARSELDVVAKAPDRSEVQSQVDEISRRL